MSINYDLASTRFGQSSKQGERKSAKAPVWISMTAFVIQH